MHLGKKDTYIDILYPILDILFRFNKSDILFSIYDILIVYPITIGF